MRICLAEQGAAIDVDDCMDINLLHYKIVYSWELDGTTTSTIVKGRFYHIDLNNDTLSTYFRPIQHPSRVSDRFIAIKSGGVDILGFECRPLRAFDVNSMPYGGPVQVSVGENGLRSATIIVTPDLSTSETALTSTRTSALVRFESRYRITSITNIGLESWEEKYIRLVEDCDVTIDLWRSTHRNWDA